MTVPLIADLPTPPSRADSPSTFSSDASAFLAALPTLQAEKNAQAEALNDLADEASAAVAEALSGISAQEWVSGTTYARGVKVWSPTDGKTYRRKSSGAGTTDPSADSTNWALIVGTGNVKLTAQQTLTNKTLTRPVIDGTITEDSYTITDGASVVIDPANGSIQNWTLGAGRTPTGAFANGEAVTLHIADGTAYSVNWASMNVFWMDEIAPVLPTTGYAVVELWMFESQMYGAYTGDVA